MMARIATPHFWILRLERLLASALMTQTMPSCCAISCLISEFHASGCKQLSDSSWTCSSAEYLLMTSKISEEAEPFLSSSRCPCTHESLLTSLSAIATRSLTSLWYRRTERTTGITSSAGNGTAAASQVSCMSSSRRTPSLCTRGDRMLHVIALLIAVVVLRRIALAALTVCPWQITCRHRKVSDDASSELQYVLHHETTSTNSSAPPTSHCKHEQSL
mmetsp:Transcript_17141/g.56801  ORF Transcript_17141/g.56801 Transcript_17141/m.56801 type:complete len:218 (-) Transcript_17141:1516-2169(-)